MTLATFLPALALLLAVPGPTNMILAVAAAERGMRGALPLSIVVLCGYLSVILPLLFLAAPVLRAYPAVGDGITLLAALWVLLLASRLWSTGTGRERKGHMTALQVFMTTVLNPKGLVIGLALIPPSGFPAVLPHLAMLAVVVTGVSVLWIALGATAVRTIGLRHPALVGRLASTCLMFFSAGLAARAAGLL